MLPEHGSASGWGLLTAGVLAIAIFAGLRNLRRIDAALVGYTYATGGSPD